MDSVTWQFALRWSMHVKLTCMSLTLNTGKPSALLQKSSCAERNGESADGPFLKPGVRMRTAAVMYGGLALAVGEELRQRRVMLESQMGEPVRSKMMCTEGGRLGRAARHRSFSLRTLSTAEVVAGFNLELREVGIE